MDRRRFLGTVGTAAFSGLAGCSGILSGERAPQEYDIGMSSSAFLPAHLEVIVGETVTWANTGARAHSVTAYEDDIPEGAAYFASGGFDSEQVARDAWLEDRGGAIYSYEIYEHTFEIPGRYTYFCIPHEPVGMVGQITVVEE